MPEHSPLDLLPPLNRARGFRLYAGNGGRFVDLWLQGGAALLGHNPPGVLRELKNAAARGLTAPLPHLRENRLARALSRLFPSGRVLLFTGEESLRRALREAGVPGADSPFPDPALGGGGGEAAPALSLWRPFLPAPDSPLLAPVLPWPLAPAALVLRAGGEGAPAGAGALRGERVSPVISAAAARSVHDLAAAAARGAVNYPRLWKALSGGPWIRRGIYLSLREPPSPEAYEALFRRFLDAGFLLPPGPCSPLILPGLLSPGEEAKLAALIRWTGPPE